MMSNSKFLPVLIILSVLSASVAVAATFVTSVAGQGNCVSLNLNYHQNLCIGFSGILESTNITTTTQLGTGALAIGYFVSDQPNCNAFVPVGSQTTLYPTSNLVQTTYEIFVDGTPTVFAGVLVSCVSLKSCTGFVCNSFSPYSQVTQMAPIQVDSSQQSPVRPASSPRTVDSNTVGYTSFKIVASTTQWGADCLAWPSQSATFTLSCSDPSTYLLTLNSATVLGYDLYFKGCNGNSLSFSVIGGTNPTFQTPLQSNAFNDTTIGSCVAIVGSSCCQAFGVRVLGVVNN